MPREAAAASAAWVLGTLPTVGASPIDRVVVCGLVVRVGFSGTLSDLLVAGLLRRANPAQSRAGRLPTGPRLGDRLAAPLSAVSRCLSLTDPGKRRVRRAGSDRPPSAVLRPRRAAAVFTGPRTRFWRIRRCRGTSIASPWRRAPGPPVARRERNLFLRRSPVPPGHILESDANGRVRLAAIGIPVRPRGARMADER